MKLIITLEDGQKTEGAVRSFSELPLKRDEKQFAGITMTYHVFLPVNHPMFKKIVCSRSIYSRRNCRTKRSVFRN